MTGVIQQFGTVQEGFGGDTALIEAHASKFPLFKKHN